ncbi:MAG: hypothetical protein NTW84_06145, partial [Methanothrix sp.]|nr:hypothetical protein [Methanothrix sp.]
LQSEKDGFDVRTVRTHIDLAKQEREGKEARTMVLRNALERHYSDLCEYAEKLSVLTQGESAAGSSREKYIHSALRQHLPRSPIWNYLKQREALNQQVALLSQQAAEKLEEMVRSDSQVCSRPDIKEMVTPGIIDVLKFQLDKWVQGLPGLTINDRMFEQSAGELVNLHYGAFHLGNMTKEDVKLIRKVVADLEPHVRQLEEYEKLEKLYTDLKRVRSNLEEELAVITLRRIVPGRCRYCSL